MEIANHWAQRLGLVVVSPFFPSRGPRVTGEHCAMLDGRRASFACSMVDVPDISAEDSRNWQWSSDLGHHVFLTKESVFVRSGRDPIFRQFTRVSVENRLEEFITFLDSSRRATLPDVVSFLVEEFRTIWGAGNFAAGDEALSAFLCALHAAGESDFDVLHDAHWQREVAADIGIGPEMLFHLDARHLTDYAKGIQARAPLGLRLVPSLVLRHAAGRLFQEAHAIVESVQLGLFGNNTLSLSTAGYSPAGAYFTPLPIARLLAEWAIQQRANLPNELTIADYACGSAVFLTEALRALERRQYRGTIRLIGRDKSPQAIMMSRVAVNAVLRDLTGIRVVVDLEEADAFEAAWPAADIVLMNPPFRSWERMDERERAWVSEVTRGVGRPDLSVGFIERGVRSLRPSGSFVTLLPAGVLASDSLSKWRDSLLDRTAPSLVAVLGEHGLFQHALVNVGILALEQDPARSNSALRVAWSSANTGSASRVIRGIRRSLLGLLESSVRPAADWNITATSLSAWRQKPSWLPGPGTLGPLLDAVHTRTPTRVDDLFQVRQGIRTGANDVFVHPRKIVESLPRREQSFFKSAVDAASFVEGKIAPSNLLFVPDAEWQSEDDVQRSIPTFFRTYLEPRKAELKARKRKSRDPNRWWELTWPRSWAFDGRPRLVSKRFGLFPAFARDFEGSLAVVQANAWIPRAKLSATGNQEADRELLTAYWWLLNSRVIVSLFREYCPNVAGGQLDLEHKYVRHVPLPDLSRQFAQDSTLQLLASSLRTRFSDRLPPTEDRDQFAASAFGTNLSDWNLVGLELPQ